MTKNNSEPHSSFISLKLAGMKRESFFKGQMKKNIFLYIFLEIKPFRVQYGVYSLTNKMFNNFYIICLKIFFFKNVIIFTYFLP